MKKLFLLIAICLFCACPAQDVATGAITVNGLRIGGRYTMRQMTDALGAAPAEISEPAEEDAYPDAYELRYGKDRFGWVGGEFHDFTIRTSGYVVNGGIRIGDPITRIKELGGIAEYGTTQTKWVRWRPSAKGIYAMTSMTFYYNDYGKIYMISADIMDL